MRIGEIVFFNIILIIGALGTLFDLHRRKNALLTWQNTPATVTMRGFGNRSVIYYAYTFQGTEYIGRDNTLYLGFFPNPKPLHKGSEIDILVNPLKPKQSILYNDSWATLDNAHVFLVSIATVAFLVVNATHFLPLILKR